MLSFRKMTPQDLPEVASIESDAGPHPWNEKHYADSLNSQHVCMVAEQEGKLVAQGVVMIAGGEASLLILTVARKAQGKGYGQAMLQHLTEEASDKADTLFLEVRASNKAAFNLYLKEGFSEIGRRRNYYPASKNKGPEDAIVMALDLTFYD
jgi:ribosomal-protein-alanine N-acetyltransferase